jgi:hypothetical protein
MISLAIGDIRHNPDYAWLTLRGGTLLPGLLGALYEPAASTDAVVQESITLTLKGTHAQMDLILNKLEDKLALANRFTHEGVGFPHYLRVKADPSGGYFYARILEASLAPKENSLAYYARGSLGVELTFLRPNYFDSDEIILPLANSAFSGVTNGLPLLNHDDSAHDNAFLVAVDDLETDLPAPLRLEITNTYAGGALKDLSIGSFQYNLHNSLPQLVYEAEDGSGGSEQPSASASNGKFQRFTWSAVGWTDLTDWSITPEDLNAYQGRMVTPLLRLASMHAHTGLLMKLGITSGGTSLYEGGEVAALAGKGYLVFPLLRLPCGDLLGLTYPRAQQLHLHVYKAGSASVTLDLDDLLLIPQDSFNQYLGLVPLMQNDRLVDDAFEGLSYGVQSDYELGTHITLSRGHFIQPGHAACFMVFQGDADGVAPIDRAISVRAWYRQRRRIL